MDDGYQEVERIRRMSFAVTGLMFIFTLVVLTSTTRLVRESRDASRWSATLLERMEAQDTERAAEVVNILGQIRTLQERAGVTPAPLVTPRSAATPRPSATRRPAQSTPRPASTPTPSPISPAPPPCSGCFTPRPPMTPCPLPVCLPT